MKRYLMAAACVVPMILLVAAVQAEDKKPAKAPDVVVKHGDRAGKAKVGQTIELQLPNTPPPAAEDIKVTVDGDAIDKTTEKRAEVVTEGGKPVSGKGSASVLLTAKAVGTANVKVEYKADGKKESREYKIEVE